MEVVGVAEADGVCDFGHRHLGVAKKLHSGVDAHTVYIINRGLADTFLKHLGKVVGRYVDHSGELLYVYLFLKVRLNIADNGS